MRNGLIQVNRHSSFNHYFSIGISSRSDGYEQASINLIGFGVGLTFFIPNWIIRPYKEEHKGGFNYVEDCARVYSFSYCSDEGYISIDYGLQHSVYPGKSKSLMINLPWRQWRFIRHSVYNLDGTYLMDCPKNYLGWHETMEKVPRKDYIVLDFDGEEAIATVHIEEREWRLGEGLFKFSSWLVKPQIKRLVEVEFDKEVGVEKGSWKGGITATGIEMLEGETIDETMQRFCKKEGLRLCP